MLSEHRAIGSKLITGYTAGYPGSIHTEEEKITLRVAHSGTYMAKGLRGCTLGLINHRYLSLSPAGTAATRGVS